MSELSLRGMRIGSASSLSDRVTELAPRARHTYTCPQGHTFTVVLATEAAAPAVWGCRCGEDALGDGATAPPARAVRTSRTHWQILLERRTIPELEKLLAERLQALHSGRDGMGDEAIDLVRPALSNPRGSTARTRKSA